MDFLAGGGDMGGRIRAFPWAGSALGDPARWPQALRTTVRILLSTGHPTMIMWGPDLTCLYNDAFSRSLGPEKHPSILGMPARRAWEEVWPVVGAQIEQVVRGEGAVWHENVCVPIIRYGSLQEVYWTYSYSPIDEPAYPNGVGGVLVTCAETTAQVMSERKLASEREKVLQLFHQAPTFLAVLRGPDHVCEMANPAYLALISHRPVVGRRVAEALPEAVTQGYVALLDEVYRSGKPYAAWGARFDYSTSPGGALEERYVDFIYQPITGENGAVTGILVQGVDVTARARSDLALTMNRARLDYATRLSGVGFWYCDLPFDELQWDDRVKEHFFFAPTDRITIDDFYARIHEDDRELTRRAIAESIDQRTQYDIVYRTVHPGTGEVKWIRALGGTDYAADGTPRHFDGVTVDVTAQKLDQQRLAQLNRQLQEQDRRKDEFIATLSHELRNPLAPIRAAAKVIASPAATSAQLGHAQMIIERQVNHMSLLLEDLLDIARITQGKLQLKKAVHELIPIVDAAVEAVRPTLESKNQTLALDLPGESVWLDADHLRLSQVISNLLMNAAKYSDPGGKIALIARVKGPTIEISVKDNGIGISPESLAGIFEMFSQVDGEAGRADGGLGIGLALVRGIVELHGGHVEARSEGLGRGSEFIVRLPLAARASASAGGVIEQTRSSPAGLRILVADDNRDAAESLAMLLEISGHEVRVAHDGRNALAVAQVFRPDTALLDIGMPDMSGYEVARALRNEEWAADLRLIALTGWGQDADRRQAMDAGFDHHEVKPVDPERLARLIER
jgi:signal transduction histidine kinase